MGIIEELRAIAEAHSRTMGDLAELCWAVAQQDRDEEGFDITDSES